MFNRNYNDPVYKKWRQTIYRRDGFKCQYPGCRSTKRLHAHHIKRWAEYPAMRFSINNGITLCKKHHDMVWGKEEAYEQLFIKLIINKISKDNK